MSNTITTHAYARAGLAGNPSDGYFGKTISFIIRNFRATVTLEEADHFEVLPGENDIPRHHSVHAFLGHQKLFGYYGGSRLVLAAIKRFHDYFNGQNQPLPDRKFTISYQSNIPRSVGMAGSSAIIVAAMRALLQFYQVEIPKPVLASVVLAAENEELNIAAGLQDRVIQVYEGITCMDFRRDLIESRGYGDYETVQPPSPPPLYVAFDPERAKVSGGPHAELRKRWNDIDPLVHQVMKDFRDLVDRAKWALLQGDWESLGECIDENFEYRRKIMTLKPEAVKMVDVARTVGASAHFSGSGGAIAGLCDNKLYPQLVSALEEIGCTVLRPQVYA